MRSLQFSAVLVLLLVAETSPASAQDRSWELWIGGGAVFPLGDLSDDARRGLAVQGSLVRELGDLPVKIRADLFYHDAEAAEREPGIDVSLGGEWYRQIGGALYAQLALPTGDLQSYGLLGAGLVREWHGDRTFREERQNSFNVNLGAGVSYPFFGVGGFLEARYMNLLGSDALRTGPPAVHREIEFRTFTVTFGFRL